MLIHKVDRYWHVLGPLVIISFDSLTIVGCVSDEDCDPPNSFCDSETCHCRQTVCPLKWTNGELVNIQSTYLFFHFMLQLCRVLLGYEIHFYFYWDWNLFSFFARNKITKNKGSQIFFLFILIGDVLSFQKSKSPS